MKYYFLPVFVHCMWLLLFCGTAKAGFEWKGLFQRAGSIKSNTSCSDIVASSKSHTTIADKLTYVQTMAAGALSRTMAQTIMHPANTYKTILQLRNSGKNLKLTPERLLRGADAQFLMSLPHGAFYFCVIDVVKKKLGHLLPSRLTFLGDFSASTISTIICSIVSTPQMVLTDRLMAGVYTSSPEAIRTILKTEGLKGFYTGWWPALAQKIPSYGLTWMFFQQSKRMHEDLLGSAPNAETNFALGAVAAAASVCVMIPVDTIKTRLVTQIAGNPAAYKGMRDCFFTVLREEGVGAFYKSLPPRLMSVVPMIAIQFGIYEVLKDRFEHTNFQQRTLRLRQAAAAAKAKAIEINEGVRSKVSSRHSREIAFVMPPLSSPSLLRLSIGFAAAAEIPQLVQTNTKTIGKEEDASAKDLLARPSSVVRQGHPIMFGPIKPIGRPGTSRHDSCIEHLLRK